MVRHPHSKLQRGDTVGLHANIRQILTSMWSHNKKTLRYVQRHTILHTFTYLSPSLSRSLSLSLSLHIHIYIYICTHIHT